MNQKASPVDHKNLFAEPDRALRDKTLKQEFVFEPGCAAERSLDLTSNGGRERGILWAERRRRSGNVDDAEKLAIDRMSDRHSGAGPALDILTKMFRAANARGSPVSQRGADRVGTDDALNDARIARGLDDEAAGIGQDHH